MIGKLVNFFGDEKYRRTRWRLLLAVLVAVVLADFLVTRQHVEHDAPKPGFGTSMVTSSPSIVQAA